MVAFLTHILHTITDKELDHMVHQRNQNEQKCFKSGSLSHDYKHKQYIKRQRLLRLLIITQAMNLSDNVLSGLLDPEDGNAVFPVCLYSAHLHEEK